MACVFTMFLGGDRVILPVILEWKDDHSMSSGDLKESWLQEYLKFFPKRDAFKDKYGAAGIVHNRISPILVGFSYNYAYAESMVIEPKLTAYVSEKKAISNKFPWEALGELFMDVLCVKELSNNTSGTQIEKIIFKNASFHDQPPPKLYELSSTFKIHEKCFQIDLPRESWKVNDFFGCVWSCDVCLKRSSEKVDFSGVHCVQRFVN